jgi:hypothetical protein
MDASRSETGLSDEELKAIGRIALRDALVSQIVEWALWKLIDSEDDNIGATLTKRWSFARVVEKLEALAPLRLEAGPFQDQLRDWTRRAIRVHQDRNSIVHSALTRLQPDDQRLTHIRIIPGEEEALVEFRSFDAASLNYIADALDKIAEEGAELFGRLEEGVGFK